MTDDTTNEETKSLDAHGCQNGHWTIPDHPMCPTCGEPQTRTVDISDESGSIVTWTTSTATPPGVREPNHLAIVEFTVEGTTLKILGQLTTGDVKTGMTVTPTYVDELRDPDEGIRHPDSQGWDGFRFDPSK